MSDETNWSPGPWTVYPLGQAWGVEAKVKHSVVVWGDDPLGREGGVCGRTQKEMEANGRLIAAAPELYEALYHLYAFTNGLADSGDSGFWNLEDYPEGKQALSALTKARGEP